MRKAGAAQGIRSSGEHPAPPCSSVQIAPSPIVANCCLSMLLQNGFTRPVPRSFLLFQPPSFLVCTELWSLIELLMIIIIILPPTLIRFLLCRSHISSLSHSLILHIACLFRVLLIITFSLPVPRAIFPRSGTRVSYGGTGVGSYKAAKLPVDLLLTFCQCFD